MGDGLLLPKESGRAARSSRTQQLGRQEWRHVPGTNAKGDEQPGPGDNGPEEYGVAVALEGMKYAGTIRDSSPGRPGTVLSKQ